MTKQENSGKLEKILALILINSLKGATMADKAEQLSLAEFTNVEIADLLKTKSNIVAQMIYANRKKKSRN